MLEKMLPTPTHLFVLLADAHDVASVPLVKFEPAISQILKLRLLLTSSPNAPVVSAGKVISCRVQSVDSVTAEQICLVLSLS